MAAHRVFLAWPCVALALLLAAGSARAQPWQPTSDQEVVETLPTQTAARQQQARWRQALAASPRDASVAVAAARQYLALARDQGDARYAGLALGALGAWPLGRPAPTEVLVTRATVAQYLHDFEGAAALLQQALLASPTHAQAWLTLATVRRVQARLADSDAACKELLRLGQAVHGGACLAENQSLRGRNDEARQALLKLLSRPEAQATSGPGLRQWLLTTLAELEERAGRNPAADKAWQQAQALGPHPYVQTGHADHLIRQERFQEALVLLKDAPLTDAVLLRLSVAGQRMKDPRAAEWTRTLQQNLSASRPDSAQVHAREQARFALEVLKQPQQALSLARLNLKIQRETADLLVFAQAAAAQPSADLGQAAQRELAQWTQTWGMQDARLPN